MPIQEVDSLELLDQDAFTNYSQITSARIATSDIAQESLPKRFMLDENLDLSFLSYARFFDLSAHHESGGNIDANGNLITIKSSSNELEYLNNLLTSDSWNAQLALSLLDTNSDNTHEFVTNAINLPDTSELDVENACKLSGNEDATDSLNYFDCPVNALDVDYFSNGLDSEGNFTTQSDQELMTHVSPEKELTPLEKLHIKTSGHIIESASTSINSYVDKNGNKKGTCLTCGRDKLIRAGWGNEYQICDSCSDQEKRLGICSKCAQGGNTNPKIIHFHRGQEDQLCMGCRKKEQAIGICSKCLKESVIDFHFGKKDQLCNGCRVKEVRKGVCSSCNKEKKINFHFGKKDQMCSYCRKLQVNMGVCSQCAKKGDQRNKIINFNKGKPDQMCKTCRNQMRKFEQAIERIMQEE